MRGYLWERLPEEIIEEMAALMPQPFVKPPRCGRDLGWKAQTYYLIRNLVRPEEYKRALGPQKTDAEYVKDFRKKNKEAGFCISCNKPRTAKSKNYCEQHREEDRMKAAAKRRNRNMQKKFTWTQIENRHEAYIGNNFIGYVSVYSDNSRANVMGEPVKVFLLEADAKKYLMGSSRARMFT